MKQLGLNLYIEFLVLIVVVAVFGTATYQRNLVWSDDLVLWSDVVKKSPHKARGYNAIGMYYYERQKHDQAIPFFQQSLFLHPEHAKAHNNLGLCLLGKGRIDEAIEAFEEAIKAKPSHGMYHVNLGIAYWKKGLYQLGNMEIQRGKDLRRKPKR